MAESCKQELRPCSGELRAVESCYGTRVDVAAVDGAGETAAEIVGRMGVDVGAFV